MSANVFKGLMECCRLIPAAGLINIGTKKKKAFNLYVNATWALISSAHLHLEKNNKLKFNVAIMSVYGDGGKEEHGMLDDGASRLPLASPDALSGK